MKSKDQELLEEAYKAINEGHDMVTIQVPSELWKNALNAHKLPNSAEVLAKIMGDIVNAYVKKQKEKKQQQADEHDYNQRVERSMTSAKPEFNEEY